MFLQPLLVPYLDFLDPSYQNSSIQTLTGTNWLSYKSELQISLDIRLCANTELVLAGLDSKNSTL